MASPRRWFELLARRRPTHADATRLATAAGPEIDVERLVRDRLYRAPELVTAIPAPGARDVRGSARRADPRAPERPGRLVGGRYLLLDRVGRGGMATGDAVHHDSPTWCLRMTTPRAPEVIFDAGRIHHG